MPDIQLKKDLELTHIKISRKHDNRTFSILKKVKPLVFLNRSNYLDAHYLTRSPLATCVYLRLKKLINIKTQFLCHISHLSSAIHVWLVDNADTEHLLNSSDLDKK